MRKQIMYETGIKKTDSLGTGTTYRNTVYFVDEQSAREAFKKSGRNYLYRITTMMENGSMSKKTEWWDEETKHWREVL